MKEVRLLSWKPGFLGVKFLLEIRKNNIYGLIETRKVISQLVSGAQPSMFVQEDKLDTLLHILDGFPISYEVE